MGEVPRRVGGQDVELLDRRVTEWVRENLRAKYEVGRDRGRVRDEGEAAKDDREVSQPEAAAVPGEDVDIFVALLHGFRTAPLLWSRVYLDDSLRALLGRSRTKALGVKVSHKKRPPSHPRWRTIPALRTVSLLLFHWRDSIATSTSPCNPTVALAMADKLTGKSPAMNRLGAEMADRLEEMGLQSLRAVHVPGAGNKVADYINRPHEREGDLPTTRFSLFSIFELWPHLVNEM
eukprot:s2482_g3.t2